MKKRAMKKWIPEGDYCYVIQKVHILPNGMNALRVKYCKNRYYGHKVHTEMSDNKGGYVPVTYRKIMCRYLNDELIYNDSKECCEKIVDDLFYL